MTQSSADCRVCRPGLTLTKIEGFVVAWLISTLTLHVYYDITTIPKKLLNHYKHNAQVELLKSYSHPKNADTL